MIGLRHGLQGSRGIEGRLQSTERSLNKQSGVKKKTSQAQIQNKKRECESHRNDKRFKSNQKLKRQVSKKMRKNLS